MATAPVWHGDSKESDALTNAINSNCCCTHALSDERTVTCGPHKLLLEDQRALDGLLWMRRQAEKLLEEEGCP